MAAMPSTEPEPDDRPDQGSDHPVEPTAFATLRDGLRDRPGVGAVLGVLVVLIVAYATLVQQELFLAVWFLFLLFVAHLSLRFVRAIERIAGAAEALVAESGTE